MEKYSLFISFNNITNLSTIYLQSFCVVRNNHKIPSLKSMVKDIINHQF